MRKKISFRENFFKALSLKKIVLFAAILFLSNQSISQNYAFEFRDKQKDSLRQEKVYLYVNPHLNLKSERISKMSGFEDLDSITQEDFLKKYTLSYGKVKDSIVVQMFSEQLIKTLEKTSMKVIKTHPEDFPSKLSEREHIINVAQIEIEEYLQNDSICENGYCFKKEINGIRLNTWIVYNETDTASSITFYCSEENTDILEGEIIDYQGKKQASYDIIPLTPNEIYTLSYDNGIKAARYFFNFLMNKYVWINSKAQDKFFYSLDTKSLNIIRSFSPFDNFDVIERK